jgi:hypothetical protein
MATVLTRLTPIAASWPCRLVVFGFGAAVLWLYGVRIFAGLLNPMNVIHFALAAYLGLSALASFALMPLKDAWLLLFIAPAVLIVGADMVLPRP